MPQKVIKDRNLISPPVEKGFELPLPALIEGRNASGDSFKEKTVLSYISSTGTSFWMYSKVELGSDLRLYIDLPPKLSEGDDLKLKIKGKVIFIETSKDQKSKNRVSVKFDTKYVISGKNQE